MQSILHQGIDKTPLSHNAPDNWLNYKNLRNSTTQAERKEKKRYLESVSEMNNSSKTWNLECSAGIKTKNYQRNLFRTLHTGAHLTAVDQTRYLEVLLDSDLLFADHLKMLLQRAYPSLRLIYSGQVYSESFYEKNVIKVFMQSEEYKDELHCLGLFNSNRKTKLIAGSSLGRLHLYNWPEFGMYSDLFPSIKRPIHDLVVVTENILVTACEDGKLRAIHLFPNRHLGIVGEHNYPVDHVDICNTGQFIASSTAEDIKFWNVQYFEDFEGVSNKHKKHQKKREMRHHLPSSNVNYATDFFSDLCSDLFQINS